MSDLRANNGLVKRLGLASLTMVAIGSCIGSGIFATPADIATQLPQPLLIFAVWALGGLIALTGALTFAELGAMFPEAGGVYAILRHAYGKSVAFLYGWCILLAITSGAIAALALVFAQYFAQVVPMNENAQIALAAGAIVFLTLLNVRGVETGALFARVFTWLKLSGIAGLVGVGLYFLLTGSGESIDMSLTSFGAGAESAGTGSDLATGAETGSETSSDAGADVGSATGLAAAFAVALIGVLWSYGGWHHASFLAGETKKPGVNIPRAMILGAAAVGVTYMLVNLAYLSLLPIEEITASKAVAADALRVAWPAAGTAIAALIAVSVFGTIGIYTMTAPRIYFAMARDGVFFKSLAKVHPRYKTPVNAIVLQSAWSIVLLLLFKTFGKLISYVVFLDFAFMCLAGFSIFLFRRKLPLKQRPYRTTGYPIVPLFYCGVLVWFTAVTLWGGADYVIAGLVILGAGFICQFAFKKFSGQSTTS